MMNLITFTIVFIGLLLLYKSDLNIPDKERQALYDLYLSTNGDQWIWQKGAAGHWNFTDKNVNPCDSSNTWQGLSCFPVGAYNYIVTIELGNYSLRGNLEKSIGDFTVLYYIDLQNNQINGSIPDSIGNLGNLFYLFLTSNYLTGSIPSSLGSLTNLNMLYLRDNYLSSTIPESVGSLSNLQYLILDDNKLTGTIPKSLSNLNKLLALYLSSNILTGTIPNSIGELINLNQFVLEYNYLTGSIPTSIGNLTHLMFLYFNDNLLSNSIPDSFDNLVRLQYFFLSSNHLTGSFPNSLGNLIHLIYFYVSFNSISSTIPESFENFGILEYFFVNSNKLTGMISKTLGNLKNLQYLYLNENKLYGEIPESFCNLSSIKQLNLFGNQLTGSIPHSFSKLISIEGIYLSNNLLSNTIPDIFHDFSQLSIIQIDNNIFDGTIPPSISQLPLLTLFFIQNNDFQGTLNDVFNGTYQSQLTSIQLDNNHFTGTIPEEVYLSYHLQTFTAAKNCFHGSISSTICKNKQLIKLILDGIGCASTCRSNVIPGISSAYLSDNEVDGTIPQCLWSMSNLQILHLSGNSITGCLPSFVNLSTALVNLSLSHNLLSGSIPIYIQKKSWNNLDLSNNRFSGMLHTNFYIPTDNSTLSLTNNRLSGFIPTNLKYAKNIEMLKGNLYDCKYDRSDLPHHDENRDDYECGSNTFNVIYYIWIGILFTIIISTLVIYYYKDKLEIYFPIKSLIGKLSIWLQNIKDLKVDNEIYNQDKMKYLKQYYNLHELLFQWSSYSVIFITIILLPTFIVISNYCATHQYEYAWIVSMIYLSGIKAFVIIMVLLVTFVIVQIILYLYSIKRSSYDIKLLRVSKVTTLDQNGPDNDWKNRRLIYAMCIVYVIINFILVSGINIAYVYVILYENSQIIILVQILLSIFKLVWNGIISPYMIHWIIYYATFYHMDNQNFLERLFLMQFIVSIINNIIIPCLIVAFISPNCFYHLFQQVSEVKSFPTTNIYCSIYLYDVCTTYGTTSSAATSYDPPFIYSYQCSSDFVIYYSPVFVFTCIISSFFVPILRILIAKYSNFIWFKNKLYDLVIKDVTTIIYAGGIYELLSFELTFVGLLLTFGTVFPLLGVVFWITICCRIYYHKATLGRYISYAIKEKAFHCLDVLAKDCMKQPSPRVIQSVFWILLYVICIFYTLFLFDILGDDVGYKKAYWVLIVMPCIPICIYFSYKFSILYFNYKNHINEDNDNVHLNELELSPSMIINPLATTTTINNDNNSSSSNNNTMNLNVGIDGNIECIDIIADDRDGNSIIINKNDDLDL